MKKISGFLKMAAVVMIFPAIFSSCESNEYPEEYGLALYTVRNAMNEDVPATIQKVAETGYSYVEAAGYNLEDGTFYGMKPAKFKEVLENNNIRAISSHTGVLPLMDEQGKLNREKANKLIEDHAELGVEYIVNPYFPQNLRDSLQAYLNLAGALNELGKMASEQDMKVLYHNHAFEFDPLGDSNAYQILLENLDEQYVNFQMDCYWVVKAGHDPVAIIREHEGRFPAIHVKDMEDSEEQFFAEVGQGTIDYREILNNAKDLGVEVFLVEQDRSRRDPMESMQMSYEYLSSLNEE